MPATRSARNTDEHRQLQELLHWAMDGEPLTSAVERVEAGDSVLRRCRECEAIFETRRCRGRYPQRCGGCRV